MQIAALIFVILSLSASTSFVVIPSTPAHAQEPQGRKVVRIGLLRAAPWPKTWIEEFQQALQERGYVDGQNLIIKIIDGSVEQLPRLAAELVRSKPDVIVASAAPAALAAKQATTSVPIVFVAVFDPIELGLVPSLASPAGNITGLALTSADLAGKRLELFRELVPKLRRVAVLWDEANPGNLLQFKGPRSPRAP